MRDQTTYLATETIRSLREQRGLTQRSLAEAIGVTDKAISKWESGRGLPDIALIDPIARALGISAAELLTGDVRTNENRAGNMLRSVFHVCPICGNIVFSLGEGSFSCCGSTLIPCEAEEPDEGHALHVERLDGEWYVTLEHPSISSASSPTSTPTAHASRNSTPSRAPRRASALKARGASTRTATSTVCSWSRRRRQYAPCKPKREGRYFPRRGSLRRPDARMETGRLVGHAEYLPASPDIFRRESGKA